MPNTLTRIDVSAYRVPIEQPVATSFGVMTNRPAVFVRVEDRDGAFGFGEVFANWPAAGAEHRVRLVADDFAYLLVGVQFDGPTALFETLTKQTHIRALQCGEWGPFRQVIAGLDTGYRDLLARKAGVPLAQALNADAGQSVPCYASGIAIAQAGPQIAQSRRLGFDAFKVKVGFNLDTDCTGLDRLVPTLDANEMLFADANQAWDLQTAQDFTDRVSHLPLGWLEEPLPADAPLQEWEALAQSTRIPLAGGENITGIDDFAQASTADIFRVLQPDVAKWGGITGCWAVAQSIRKANKRYCPHFLGGGIGLIASAHLLAAAGGDGLLEVDVNPNPLRDAFDLWGGAPSRARLTIPDAPGLGITALPDDIDPYLTMRETLTV